MYGAVFLRGRAYACIHPTPPALLVYRLVSFALLVNRYIVYYIPAYSIPIPEVD